MTRKMYIEAALRKIYGGYIPDDSEITFQLVNQLLEPAIAIAAKTNYVDSVKIDTIGYINNSFYTTYKSLSVSSNEQFVWKITLPQIPVGIGENDGAETLIFKDSSSQQLSYPVIFITQKQRGFQRGRRPIPNKIIGYFEGNNVYLESTLSLSDYTAQITMISGGDSTDLNSTLNVPSDYFPVMDAYIEQKLLLEQSRPKDSQNDGSDLGNKE